MQKNEIFLDLQAKDKEEALDKIVHKLKEQHVVKDGYDTALLAREKEYPTGLKVENYGVAIPHTEADLVNQSEISFTRLTKPVVFHQMGDNQEVKVNFIFILSLTDANDHLKKLQNLMNIFQDNEKLHKLYEEQSADDISILLTKWGL